MDLPLLPLPVSTCLVILQLLTLTLGPSTVSTLESTASSEGSTSQATTTTTPMSTTANDLVCYGCSDTQRGGDCQTNTKDMRSEAQGHLGKPNEEQTSWTYVKRCGGYSNYSFCVIETLENRGEVHSYIRDCSDGVSFSYPSGKFSNLPADNQTTCAYTGQGYVICIRLCRTNFCNGPITTSAADTLRTSLVYLMLLTFYRIFVR